MSKKIAGIAAIVFTSVVLYGFTGKDRQFTIAKSMDVFSALYKEINAYYVDEVNANTLMNKGVDQMLSSLDPYTVYIPEDKIEDYRINNDGDYVGIGALTSKIKEDHIVMMVFEKYPAYEAGLRIGDKILNVDGNPLKGKSDDELRKLIKGQMNSTVKMTVDRYGSQKPIELDITRKKLEINSVSYSGLVDDKIGYVKLNQFSAKCSQHVLEATKKVIANGATSIVLDLRGNPGGFLHEAVNISNLFLPKNEKIVDTKGKNPIYTRTYRTLNEPLDVDIPLAVLINKKSASASEIVSGVIQDYDRGVLIGEKSYGKGLVQKTWKLPYNSQLKATISKYYIPSGRCIQALDYSKKSKDGKATKIADSLRNIFYTKNQRQVYDGGGVSPDSAVIDDSNYSDFVKFIINEGHIINFANKYFYSHTDQKLAEDFILSDSEYNDFLEFLKEQDFVYLSPAMVFADTLSSRLSTVDEELASEFKNLKESLGKRTTSFLSRDKEKIKLEISKNIISRHYFESGLVKYSLSMDNQLKVAMDILKDSTAYQAILER